MSRHRIFTTAFSFEMCEVKSTMADEFVSLTVRKKAMAKNSIARQFPVNGNKL